MKKLLTVASMLVFAGSVAVAGPAHHHPAAASHQTALICPVTGTRIPSIKAAVGHSTYKGKTYYFCCPGCKPRFDKNPAAIANNAAHGHYEKM